METGEWIECEVILQDEHKRIIEDWQSARCSVCKRYHATPYLYSFSHYSYCPHCGAKMSEVHYEKNYEKN